MLYFLKYILVYYIEPTLNAFLLLLYVSNNNSELRVESRENLVNLWAHRQKERDQDKVNLSECLLIKDE